MAYVISSPYYHNHIMDEKRITRISIKIDGEEVDSGHVMDKIELSYNHANKDFTVGQVLFSTATLKVINTLQIENNSTIEINIGLKVYNEEMLDWEWIDVPFFTGEVYDIKLGETFNAVEFYSIPVQLLQQNYTPKFTKYTTRSLLIEMALELGIVIEGLETIPTATIDVDDKVRTGLDWLNIISTLLAMNVYIGRNGEINLLSIDSTNIFDVNCPSQLIGANPSRGQYPYNIQQVIIQNGDSSDDVITAGIDCPKENQIKLNNPFATQSTANNILNTLKLVRYNAFKFKWYHCPLHLDPLDFIQIEYKGEMVVIPVMNLKFTYSNGGLNCDIDTTLSNSTNKNSDFKGSLSSRVEVINKITNDLTTKVEVTDGKIDTLISDTTIIEDGEKIKIKDKVSQISQTADEIKTTVDSVKTDLAENYSTTQQMNSAINQKANEITSTVELTKRVGVELLPQGLKVNSTSGLFATQGTLKCDYWGLYTGEKSWWRSKAIQVDTSQPFYYRFEYECNEGYSPQIYIGLEQWRTPSESIGEDDKTVYVVTGTKTTGWQASEGTLDPSNFESDTRYIRLRVLVNWDNSQMARFTIFNMSLKQLRDMNSSTQIAQMSDKIESKVDVNGVKSTITQSASEVNIAFNNYSPWDGSGGTTGRILFNQYGINTQAPDGSYSSMGGGQMTHYIAGENWTYHSLMKQGWLGQIHGTNWSRTITLPSAFRGKVFSVIISVSEVGATNTHDVVKAFKVTVPHDTVDYNNGTFVINGSAVPYYVPGQAISSAVYMDVSWIAIA